MTQEEWEGIIKAATPKGDRLFGRPRPFVMSHGNYLRGKKEGWITQDDHLDWDKLTESNKSKKLCE